MPEAARGKTTEPQQKAAVFLARLIRFEPKSAERIAAEQKAAAEEAVRQEQEELAALAPGNARADGSISAGISPKTGKPMFAMPADAGVSMDFNQAVAYAQKLNTEKALGHDDWRVPTKEELNVLFQNREKGALKGTFNITGSLPAGWYWSSAPYYDVNAWCQRFSDGQQNNICRDLGSSVRCVR